MHSTRPSTTAGMVACMRALADEGLTTATGFRDPTAAQLLPWRWALARRVLSSALRRARPDQRVRVAAQLDAVALRVLALDERLEAALRDGVRQVVVLGAGLDTRAWRLASLAPAHVFEVDHPSTQAQKQHLVARLQPLAGGLTFVPVDFERDALLERLRAAGHQPERPTVWLWEGVVMYLSDGALRATLTAVAAASSPGSVLLLHYNEPAERTAQSRAMDTFLALSREPQIGQRPRAAIAAELGRAGFTMEEDSGQAEWAARFGARLPEGAIARQSRLAVARAGG